MESISIDFGGNAPLILESGQMARQANGAILARHGGTAILATACCSDSPIEGIDYLPLHIEYNEKYYAAGKIPGGFIKRETRPKDREILVSRLIDRPMRPLFSKSFKRDLQVIPTALSVDQVHLPDVVAMNAASAAVVISDIPFDGPVGAVRVGYVNGDYLTNPTLEIMSESTLDIVVAGTIAGITMVEGGGKEISEEILLDAIEYARKPIVAICQAQNKLRDLLGKEKLPLKAEEENQLWQQVADFARTKMTTACFVAGKHERSAAIRAVGEETLQQFQEELTTEQELWGFMDTLEQQIVRNSIVKDKKRTDGRSPTDIRDITCDINVLERAHGSALFTRGETQALVITTLGSVQDEQIMDDIEGNRRENFMLHYNFPPYSVGETGRMGTGRREVGHGHLARRAISAVMPTKEDFPYTVRVVSEILESNGSSSMATVCGSSLSLMGSGVPISQAVAGIAMGLIQEGEQTVVLSDILGEEDHLGDMDFKVAGTARGITAFQMDIKIKNVEAAILRAAVEQARQGRLHILSVMNKAIEKPSSEMSEYAPRILGFRVEPEQIGILIGSMGKTIKGIDGRFDVKTNIEEDGSVTIYCRNKQNGEDARAEFLKLLEEPEIGKVYEGQVRRIVDFGAFIEFLPGKEGLCHISKMADHRIQAVTDVLQMNQTVPVKIIEVDKMGRVNLTLLIDRDVDSQRRPPQSREPRSNSSEGSYNRRPREGTSGRRSGHR